VESQAQEPVGQTPVKWQPVHNTAFRFVFSYFVAYYLPHPHDLWTPIVCWVGKNVLHLGWAIDLNFNGSGDTTYEYVLVFCYLVLAVLATLIWSLLDCRRENYQKLEQWLKLFLRLVLGHTMLSYGSSKIFEGQFPEPGPSRLVETFGEASPMRLLWTFMGASRPYTFFAGLAEMVPGVLLFFPPLAGLGALLCALVMFNIFLLNMCYDVPVKLYSFHLLVTALYLALPDLARLARVLVLNRVVQPLQVIPLFKRETANDIALAGQVFLGILLAVWALWAASLREQREYRDLAANTPMYGVWQVDECVFAATDVVSKRSGGGPWRKLIFEDPGYVVVQLLSGARKSYGVSVDAPNHKIILSSMKDATWQRVLPTVEPAPNVVIIDAKGDGVPSHLKMHKIDAKEFLLQSRGFHWINEYPFNR